MKKFITILAVSVLFVGSMAAQSADFARWSATIKGGFTYYRLQPEAYKSNWSIFDSRVNNTSWALPIVGIEYTVNPYYGIGIEGGWFRYNRVGLQGSTVDFVLNNSVNLSNLLSPTRRGFWKKSTFYGNFGLGIGFFKNDTFGELDAEKDGSSPLAVAGLEYNYNFNSSLALVLEGQYRTYVIDALGAGPRTNYNCDAVSVNIGLRFKFHGKEKTHVRDASVAEYYTELFGDKLLPSNEKPATVDGKIKELGTQMNDLQKQLTALNSKLDKLEGGGFAQKSDVDRLNDKIKQLENDLNNKSVAVVTASFDEVRFRTGSASLSEESKAILARIIQTLKDGAGNRSIRIIGHTDNVGSEAFNMKLSQLRAETVKNFLVAHGISADKIIEVKGMGFSQPVADNSIAAGRALNRRVGFVIE